MNRLTDRELIGDGVGCVDNNKNKCNDNCMYGLCKWIKECLLKLKSYEDLEEQGLLLKLPCKVGDTVYQIPSKVNYDLNVLHGYDANNRVYHQKVSKIVLDGEYWYLECDKDREYGTGRICLDRFFGETWFLTKEEAEQELERLNNEKN